MGAGYKVPKKAKKPTKPTKKPSKTVKVTEVAKMIAEAVLKCPREQRELILQGLKEVSEESEESDDVDEASCYTPYRSPTPRSPYMSPTGFKLSEVPEVPEVPEVVPPMSPVAPRTLSEVVHRALPEVFASAVLRAWGVAPPEDPVLDRALPDGPDLPEDADYDTEGLCSVAPGETHATLDAQLAAYHDKITLRAFYRLPGSTVVATKDGLLELRRGDETWVRFKDSRRTWSSFAEWRAAIGDFTNPIAISAT